MASDQTVIIVGGGLAGTRSAECAREQGFEGRIVLVGLEFHLPYDRPPLSKEYLAGSKSLDEITLHPRDWYKQQQIDLKLGVQVTAIDRSTRTLSLSDGGILAYDKLVLATGSTPRHLPLDGADADGVLYLRTLDDSNRLKATFDAIDRLVIIGGGWIGMEAASNARAKDVEVTIVEAAALPLLAVLGPEIAQVFADLHEENGVVFHLGASVGALETTDGKVSGVRLGDGTVLPADAVIIGVGATPNLELAKDAGLDVDNGVLVDERLVSSDPDIAAVGDIAAHQHPTLGARVRVEHWANALNQPPAAVASLLGTPTPYEELPFFYTDQFDLGMEYNGYVAPGSNPTVVIRGDRNGREFLAFWLDDESIVLAGMNVNIWDVGDEIKALIRSGKPVDPAKLADTSVDLTPPAVAL
jgi:3-phenylpropionate/trans-cinnamate dioxygenase ferredoxin reductase subunit